MTNRMNVLLVEDVQALVDNFKLALWQTLKDATLRGVKLETGKVQSGTMRYNGAIEHPHEQTTGNPGYGLFHVAKEMEGAEKLLNAREYDLIFLDHKLPNREGEEAREQGYGLIPLIRQRNPNAIIVGTTSEPDAVRGYEKPDFQTEVKCDGFRLGRDLKRILTEGKLVDVVNGGNA